MSVKKFIGIAAAGIASVAVSTATLAGGPEPVAMPIEPEFQPKVYVEANVGYAKVDWRGFFLSPFKATTSNGRGGLTFGFDLGYQFVRHLSLEGGWFWLSSAKGVVQNDNALRVNSWFAYLASRLDIPVFDQVDLFGKIGVTYRRVSYRSDVATNLEDDHYWMPIFAVGAMYKFGEGWIVNAQYTRVPGYLKTKSINRRAPAANLFTAGIGYEFAV